MQVGGKRLIDMLGRLLCRGEGEEEADGQGERGGGSGGGVANSQWQCRHSMLYASRTGERSCNGATLSAAASYSRAGEGSGCSVSSCALLSIRDLL
jgi:hypothetical protein